MKIVPLAEVKAQLSEYIKKSSKETVIITKNGRPSAILAGITNDDDLEELSLLYNPHFRKLIKEAEERIKQGQGIKHELFWDSLKV